MAWKGSRVQVPSGPHPYLYLQIANKQEKSYAVYALQNIKNSFKKKIFKIFSFICIKSLL